MFWDFLEVLIQRLPAETLSLRAMSLVREQDNVRQTAFMRYRATAAAPTEA